MNLVSLYDIFVTEETNLFTSFINNKPNRKHTVNTRRLDHKVKLKCSLQIPNNLPLICFNLQLVGFSASYERKTNMKFAMLQFE